jgi:hypothetical protein
MSRAPAACLRAFVSFVLKSGYTDLPLRSTAAWPCRISRIYIILCIYTYISLGAWHGSDADCMPQQRAAQDASGGEEEQGAACNVSLAPQSVTPPFPPASVLLCEVDASAGGHAAPTIEEAWQVCSRMS